MAVTSTAATPAQARVAGAAPRRRVPAGLLFVLPFLVFYVGFLIWPMLSGLRMSFFNTSLAGTAGGFVGLDNWQEVFADPAVWDSLWNTVWFTVLSTPPLVVLGLVMALLTNRAIPGRALWRFSFFAPFLLPSAAVTLIWIWMFQPGYGLVSDALGAFGVPESNWLLDVDRAMLAVVITTIWWTVGFNFLLYLAALQAIPQDLYDAAAIDGAGGWQQFWRVTLPMLRRATGLIIILQLLASLKIFDQVYLMTNGTGGPNFVVRPILEYVYDTGFTLYRTGFASAISYMFFGLVIIVSIAQFKLFPSRQEDRS